MIVWFKERMIEVKKFILNEADKKEVRTLFQQKHSIREICVSLNMYRKPVESFLLSEGLIDTDVCKYAH